MIQWLSITRGGRWWRANAPRWDCPRSSPRAVRPHFWLPPQMQNTTWAPTIRSVFILWKFEREKHMASETERKPEETTGGTQGLTRRAALLQLLGQIGRAHV